MRVNALALVALAFGSGCFGSCIATPIQQGTCSPGSTARVDALELGAGDDPFRPLSDGDALDAVVGGQGATMVIVRLRVRGAGAPVCLAQTTRIFAADGSGDVLAQSDAALTTTPDASGTRSTGQLLLPGRIPPPGQGMLITTTAGGQTITRALAVGFSGFFDFAPAADGAPDAAPDDAGD